MNVEYQSEPLHVKLGIDDDKKEELKEKYGELSHVISFDSRSQKYFIQPSILEVSARPNDKHNSRDNTSNGCDMPADLVRTPHSSQNQIVDNFNSNQNNSAPSAEDDEDEDALNFFDE